MGLSIYNIKKWSKMLTGKSIMHVNQDKGKYFAPGEIKGYFNNLTEKVIKDPETLKEKTIPVSIDEKAGTVYFPIAIFQYGLGAYDLYLGTGKQIYFEQFMRCVKWAVKNQEESGAWNNFGFVQPEAPYSSMCQGEGCSLLLRAYKETENDGYFVRANKAIDYMLVPIDKGGTARYLNGDLYLYEYTNKECVLNGWIFSLFGLYELTLVNDEDNRYSEALQTTLVTLKRNLKKYDTGFWSMYDLGALIASPFYHHLHIAQMQAMYDLTKEKCFKSYADKWAKQERNVFCKGTAFIIKAFQKIFEKE